MKSAPYSASRYEMKESYTAENLNQLIMKVRNGDIDAIAQFLLRYHQKVTMVALDVLQDEAAARESARDTLKSAVKQLRRGVRTGSFEPWLMWLTRSDALRYTQFENPAKDSVKHSELFEADESVAGIAHIMNKYASELGKVTSISPKSSENEETPIQADSVQGDDALLDAMHRSKGPGIDQKTKSARQRAERIPKRKNNVLTVAVGLLCMILLWFVFGLVAKNINGSLLDLGYSWFNNNIFPLF